MKKILPAAAAAVFALGIGFAAPASADEDGYLTDLANHDFTGPSQEALTLGYQICTDIQHGVPQDTTVEAIYENTGESIGADEAKFIYESASIYLCG